MCPRQAGHRHPATEPDVRGGGGGAAPTGQLKNRTHSVLPLPVPNGTGHIMKKTGLGEVALPAFKSTNITASECRAAQEEESHQTGGKRRFS